MKFYGNGLVWDRDSNKPLCKFIKGELETDNEYIVDKLIELGYKHEALQEFVVGIPCEDVEVLEEEIEEEIYDLPFVDIEEDDIDELRNKVKELGIKGYATMKKETLLKKLEEVG